MKVQVMSTTTTAKIYKNDDIIDVVYNENGLISVEKKPFYPVYSELVSNRIVPEPSIVNLTPHVIRVVTEDMTEKEFEPSGTIARVSSKSEILDMGIIKMKRNYEEVVDGIPAPVPGTLYIVSTRCFQVSRRTDLISPDTTPESVTKDSNGNVYAVKQFFCK